MGSESLVLAGIKAKLAGRWFLPVAALKLSHSRSIKRLNMARGTFAFALVMLLAIAVAQDLEDLAEAQISISPTAPPVCMNFNGRAANVARCGCFQLLTGGLRLRKPRPVFKLCRSLFGRRRDILRIRRFCRPFRGNQGINNRRLLRTAQKFIDLCVPETMIVLVLKGMMRARP